MAKFKSHAIALAVSAVMVLGLGGEAAGATSSAADRHAQVGASQAAAERQQSERVRLQEAVIIREVRIALDGVNRLSAATLRKKDPASARAVKAYYDRVIHGPTAYGSARTSVEGGVHVKSVFGCIASIGSFIVTNAFPAFKFLRIKKLITAAKGTAAVARQFYSAYVIYRKSKSPLGAARAAVSNVAAGHGNIAGLRDALLGFFGVSAVVGSCFS